MTNSAFAVQQNDYSPVGGCDLSTLSEQLVGLMNTIDQFDHESMLLIDDVLSVVNRYRYL